MLQDLGFRSMYYSDVLLHLVKSLPAPLSLIRFNGHIPLPATTYRIEAAEVM